MTSFDHIYSLGSQFDPYKIDFMICYVVCLLVFSYRTFKALSERILLLTVHVDEFESMIV